MVKNRAWPAALLALLLVLGLGACVTVGNGAADQPRTTLELENQRFEDVRVYALRGGERVRIGTVPGLSTRVLTIPPSLAFGTPIRFQAEPLGTNVQPTSREVVVNPGDRIQMTVLAR
jgi:hypothetical protein